MSYNETLSSEGGQIDVLRTDRFHEKNSHLSFSSSVNIFVESPIVSPAPYVRTDIQIRGSMTLVRLDEISSDTSLNFSAIALIAPLRSDNTKTSKSVHSINVSTSAVMVLVFPVPGGPLIDIS